MTISESKFRETLKRDFASLYEGSFLHKVQDFKMGASIGQAGIPDYVWIRPDLTSWIEVKKLSSCYLRRKDLTDAQMRTFHKMLKAGAHIMIWAWYKKEYVPHDLTIEQLEYLEKERRIKLFYE